MMGGKRQCELRGAWSAFAENVKFGRATAWDRRRLLRLAWSRLRPEHGLDSGSGGQSGLKLSEKSLMMGNFMR